MTDKEKEKLRGYYGQKTVQNYFNHPNHIQIWKWDEYPVKIVVFFSCRLNRPSKYVMATLDYILLENVL